MASTKIRGITIELSADASGLSKALSGINKEIGSTQKQLKDVEKLLKLDPKNTELLKQKQELLNDAIGETKTKLKALKEAQEDVGQTLKETGEGKEQYDALSREIIACEQELQKLQQRAIESKNAMLQIAEVGDKLQKVGDQVANVGSSLTKNVTTPIIAGLGTAVKITADFDASMSKVAAISGATGDEFDALRDKAREMGETTRFSATEASEAMNYMAMAGWKTEDMLEGIEGIMNLAAASGADLATTSDIVTDALTAFGMEAKDAGKLSDILASAAANANTNVELMGESFKYVAPVAGAMGYDAEDIAVALGLMANSGIKASQAGTSLRNIMQRMAKPTKESNEALARLGVSLEDDQGNMYSFAEIMDQLREGFVNINIPIEEYDNRVADLDKQLEDGTITEKTYSNALNELNQQTFGAEGAEKARAAAMLGGSRAMAALLAITEASDEDYQKLTNAINGSTGAAEEMARVMGDNASGQLQILKSQLQELAISIGDILMPTIRDIVSGIQEFVDKLNQLDPETKEMIVKAALLAAALGPVLIVVGKLTSGIGTMLSIMPKLVSSFAKVGGAASGTVAPILAVIAVIGVLVAAFIHLWNTNDEFRKNVTDSWNRIKAEFDNFGNGIVQRLNEMGFEFENFSEVVSAIWDAFCNSLAPHLTDALRFIETQLDGFFDFITGLLDVFGGIFTNDWQRVWNGVKEIFVGVFQSLASYARGPLNDIISMVNEAIGVVNNLIEKINRVKVFGWSPNISSIGSIPLMASGGVVSSGSAIVGEAGAELLTVSGGRAMVQPLGGQSGTSELTDLLETYLPYLAERQNILLDGGVLVGQTANAMNDALGSIRARSAKR